MSVAPEEELAAAPLGAITTAPGSRSLRTGVVRVNLIPSEIAEARALRTTIAIMGGAAVVVAAGIGLLWHNQTAKQDDARSQLAAAQTENQRLTLEQQRLGSVDGLYAKVDSAAAMYQQAAGPQILWSRYLEDLRLQLPDHVWLTNFAATEGAVASAPAASGTAATAAGAKTAAGTAAGSGAAKSASASSIGQLTFAGTSYTHKDVADLLDKLAGLRGVSGSFVSTSTEALIGKGSAAVPTVNFNATAALTSDALKSAYDGTPTP